MASTPTSLEALRMEDIEKTALSIAAEARQFTLEPQQITQESLKAVLQTVETLSSKIRIWVRPPASTVQAQHGTFVLFPKLPIELRLRIWKYATGGGRVLALRHIMDRRGLSKLFRAMDVDPEGPEARKIYSDWKGDYSNYETVVLRFRRELPSVLWVCKESRNESLRRWSIHLATKERYCPLRIDPCLDTLYFPWEGILTAEDIEFETGQLWVDDALSLIQHLAFDTKRLKNLLAKDHGNPFRRFAALESITVVGHTSRCGVDAIYLGWGNLHFDVPENLPESREVLDHRHIIQELQRRFSELQVSHPHWHVPVVVLETLTFEGRYVTKRCCEMTWKEWRDR